MKSSIPVRGTRERHWWIWFAQAGLISVLGGMGIAVSALSLDLGNAVFPASALVSLIVVWSFYSWHLLGREWFGPYGLFLLSASLFNGGQAMLEVLGLNLDGVLDGRFSPELTVKALYLVALGLGALHLGAIWAVGNAPAHGRFRMHPPAEERSHASRFVGWLCILMAALPTAVVLGDVLSTTLSERYIRQYDRPVHAFLPAAIQILAALLIPGVMFLAAGSPKRRFVLMGLWSILIAYSGSMILSGIRREGAPLLISFAWLYHTRIRRLPRTALLSAGVAFLALFSIVVVTRQSQGPWLDSIGQARGTSVAVDSPVLAAIAEMGATLIAVVHTIDLIPSARPFDYGIGYAYTLLTVMPNVGWDRHPAAAHGSYSDWLIHTVDPATAFRGGGLGYSFIAEPFANFGWYGVVPLLALTGYLLVRMSDWATLTNDPARYAAVASFMAFFLFFPRAETAIMIRPLVYYSLLPYAVVGILAKKLARSRSSSARKYHICR